MYFFDTEKEALRKARCINYSRKLRGNNKQVIVYGHSDNFCVMSKGLAIDSGFDYTMDGDTWHTA